MSRLSEGLGENGWEKSWTGNKKNILIKPKETVALNLSNRIQNSSITGNYTLKVKISGSTEKVLEKPITVDSKKASPRISNQSEIDASRSTESAEDVFCNATSEKSYLYVKNSAPQKKQIIVESYGTPSTKRVVSLPAGETKRIIYNGKIDRFIVKYENSTSIECVPEKYRIYEHENKITLMQTASNSKNPIDSFFKYISAFFKGSKIDSITHPKNTAAVNASITVKAIMCDSSCSCLYSSRVFALINRMKNDT